MPDPDRFLVEFSNDGRCVADYLTGEILNRLRPDTLACLRAITIPDRITAELAVALPGRADAGALLDSLEHDTSLLSAVDRQRDAYRLQPHVRTYLLADVQRDERLGRLARAPVPTVAPSSTRFG